MKVSQVIILVISLLFAFSGVCQEKADSSSTEKRESILDKKVSIEPNLITEIPPVFRWCDRLDIRKQRIDVGGAKLYVEDEGKGTALILINGGPGGTHHYFHPWFSRVKDYSHVIYYDQRGCGLSDFKPGKNGYSVDQAVSDLDKIRKAFKIDKWVLLGYSYGSRLAQFYTIKYPEHTAGLILLGASEGYAAGPTRSSQYITKEERDRMNEISKQINQLRKDKNLTRSESTALSIYNNFLNGFWKYQGFYKPSLERIAQIALYEWINDDDFNSTLNNSSSKINLTGAFDKNPIPTLVLEGWYDMSINEQKPVLKPRNHPNGKMVVFENSAHGVYDEETDKFFGEVENFIRNLPRVSDPDIASYKNYLASWNKKRLEKITAEEDYLEKYGWGIASNRKLAKAFSRSWLSKYKDSTDFLKTGFAFYDIENYSEALFIFEKLEAFAQEKNDMRYKAVALIWQGHLLDLMGQREKATSIYKKVVDMNMNDEFMNSQYNLTYQLSPYAAERMKTPFTRKENNSN